MFTHYMNRPSPNIYYPVRPRSVSDLDQIYRTCRTNYHISDTARETLCPLIWIIYDIVKAYPMGITRLCIESKVIEQYPTYAPNGVIRETSTPRGLGIVGECIDDGLRLCPFASTSYIHREYRRYPLVTTDIIVFFKIENIVRT